MLASVPGNEAAVRQHFNLCSDRCITFDGAGALAEGVECRSSLTPVCVTGLAGIESSAGNWAPAQMQAAQAVTVVFDSGVQNPQAQQLKQDLPALFLRPVIASWL
jgi:hypothetical protein